jgi:hypothetical protein
MPFSESISIRPNVPIKLKQYRQQRAIEAVLGSIRPNVLIKLKNTDSKERSGPPFAKEDVGKPR